MAIPTWGLLRNAVLGVIVAVLAYKISSAYCRQQDAVHRYCSCGQRSWPRHRSDCNAAGNPQRANIRHAACTLQVLNDCCADHA